MMSDMISYSVSMLSAIADFLGSEPIIYIFGLMCACFVVKLLKSLTSF